jgi:hypothetical protein
LLNPGFKISLPELCLGLSDKVCEELPPLVGYVDATVDLPPQEVFSGLFIVDPRETIMAEALRH